MNLENINRAGSLAGKLQVVRQRIARLQGGLAVVGTGRCAGFLEAVSEENQAKIRELLVSDLRKGESELLAALSAIGVYDNPNAKAEGEQAGEASEKHGRALNNRLMGVIVANIDARLAS